MEYNWVTGRSGSLPIDNFGLRMLNLVGLQLKELPENVSELQHLMRLGNAVEEGPHL